MLQVQLPSYSLLLLVVHSPSRLRTEWPWRSRAPTRTDRASERSLVCRQGSLLPLARSLARSLPNCVASNSPLVQSRDGSSLLPRPHSLTPLEPTLNSHGGQARVLISALSDARSPGNNSALIGTGHGQTIQVLISILLNTSIPRRSHFQDIFLLRVLSLTISRHF